MSEMDFPVKIRINGEQAYDEISSFLGNISPGGIEYNKEEDKRYYYLNKDRNKIARTNMKESILELNSEVDKETVKIIKHIIKQERVR